MSNPLNGPGVRDSILNQAKTAKQGATIFWRNIKHGVEASSKGVIIVDSGRRTATGIYKASKDFIKGDVVCGSLCCVSVVSELSSGILVYCPIPYKITTVSVLKATSISCQRFRDLCSGDPSSPLC